MKKPETSAIDQVEVDQEAAALVGLSRFSQLSKSIREQISFFVQSGNQEENQRKEEESKALQKLFSKCKFFISREVPREMFAFAIR